MKKGYGVKALLVVVLLVAGLIGTSASALAVNPAVSYNCSDEIALVPGASCPHGGTLPTTGFPGTTPDGSPFSPTFYNVDPADIEDGTDDLSAYDTVVLVTPDAYGTNYLSDPDFIDAVESWCKSGGKLIIYTSEETDSSAYALWERSFISSNPGAYGATGWPLTITEENTLSQTDPTSPYYIDTALVGSQTDAVGDANVFTTYDPNWCEDMKALNVFQVEGPVHCYTHYGYGLQIYNGLDIDFMSGGYGGVTPSNGTDYLEKIWGLELMQPWNPTGLPCGVVIAGKLTLKPVQASNPVNTEHCVVATLVDGDGNPVEGVEVDFVVTGANSASGDAMTDANGEAKWCYTGTNQGLDTIVASCADPEDPALTLTSNDAYKEWTPPIVPPPVPSMTEWGIMATVIVLAALTPLVLRRRSLSKV